MTLTGAGSAPQPDSEPSSPDSAAAAMRRYQLSGDRVELERALLSCAPDLRRAAVRIAGASAADDLLQECFLVAIARAATFAPEMRLLPWLLGILRNVGRNQRRRGFGMRRGMWFRRGAADHGADELACDEPLPATTMDRRDWQRRIVAAANELAEPYRTVVLEHLCAETPLVQLAGRLNRTPSTVRSQLHRGLQELRRRLPAPMLAALAAVLAVRDGRATAATVGATLARPGQFRRVTAIAGVGLAFAVLLVSWYLRPDPAGSNAAAPTGAATAAVVAVPPTERPAEASAGVAVERRAAASATRRLFLRFRLPNGAPADGLPVWCDPDFVVGRTVPRVHAGWLMGRTDVDGGVAFEVPESTAVAVRLHELEPLQILPPNGGDIDWSFSVPQGHRVRFECTDTDGQPIPHPTVFACSSYGVRSPMLAVARGDDQGRGTTRTVLDRTNLCATAPGYQISQWKTVHRSNDPTQGVIARFELSPSEQRVQGRVFDSQGRALASAVVAVWSTGTSRSAPLYLRTDHAGEFATEHLPRGSWTAAAVGVGHAMAVRQCEDGELACDLVLRRGVEVSGRLVMAGDVPHERLRIATRERDCIPDNPLAALGARVAADGSFALQDVHPGKFVLGVFDGPSAPIDTAEFEVTDVAPAPLEVPLSSDAKWQVRVVDTDGRPIAACAVRSFGLGAAVGHLAPDYAATDASGRALLRKHSSPRRLALHLQSNTGHDVFPIHCVEHAEFPAGGGVLPITIDPGLPRAGVRGRIPVPLLARQGQGSLLLGRHADEQVVATGPDGTFRVDELPPGPGWRLTWSQPDPPRCFVRLAAFDLGPGEAKDLGAMTMPGLGTLCLKLAAGNGDPAQHISVINAEEVSMLMTSVRPGSEAVCQFPVGRYRLDLAGADGARVSQGVELAPDVTTTVELAGNGGQPCRMFVPESEAVLNIRDLAVSIVEPSAAATVVPHAMLARFDQVLRGWILDVGLRPGTYRVIAEGGDGVRRGGTIVVSAHSGLQTFPLTRL